MHRQSTASRAAHLEGLAEALGYLRFGGVLFADNVLWRWYTSLDTFLLGRWAGTRTLGFYSLAQQLSELPLEKISTVVNDVSLPAYVELSNDRAASGAVATRDGTYACNSGSFPLYWGFAAVAGYRDSVAVRRCVAVDCLSAGGTRHGRATAAHRQYRDPGDDGPRLSQSATQDQAHHCALHERGAGRGL